MRADRDGAEVALRECYDGGERRRPRMAYLDGRVELIGATREHEGIKSAIGCPVEAYCLAREIPFSPYGSWLLDDESEDAGIEPDECYVFGPNPRSKDRPELGIEVIWTSGGINKLEAYRRLRVAEVWFWKAGSIAVYTLEDGQYQSRDGSACLPELDLALVCRLAEVEPVSDAIAQLKLELGG